MWAPTSGAAVETGPDMSTRVGRLVLVVVITVLVVLGSSTPVTGYDAEPSTSDGGVDLPSLLATDRTGTDVSTPSVSTWGVPDGNPETAEAAATGGQIGPPRAGLELSSDARCSLSEANLTAATREALSTRIQECEEGADEPGSDGDDGEERTATVAGEASGGSVTTTGTDYEPSYELEFWAETYTPDPGLADAVLERASDTEESVWVLLQYEAEPTPEQWQAALDSGVEFGEWLTDVSYYASVPPGSLESLAEQEGIRAIAPIRSEWRVHPEFRSELSEATGDVTVTVRAMVDLEVEGLQRIDERHYRGTVSAATARDLLSDSRVAWIEEYRRPTADLPQGPQVVGAPIARSNPDYAGDLDGDGVTVGVIDSMIDPTHAHFDDITMSQATVFGPQSRNASLCNSHGMHVAGTIAGTDHGNRVGVAPDASIVWSRILGTGTITPNTCSWNNVFVSARDAYDSILAEDSDTDIISNSWGSGIAGRYVTQTRVTDNWARNHSDVLLVHSNGNNLNWVGVPANAKNTLSVGSVRDGSDGFTENFSTVETVGDSSSFNGDRGTRDNENRNSGRLKPEVYAPGEWVTAPGQRAGSQDIYRSMTGTSMAAPHVSGVAALYRQAHAGASAAEMRAALVATAMPPDHMGYGIVDANNAVFENRYEFEQSHYSGRVGEGQTHTQTVSVSSGTEELVAAVAWNDRQGIPALGGSRIIKNDLNVTLRGPNGRTVERNTDSNIKRITVDDPDPGTWEIEVHGHRIIKDNKLRQSDHPSNLVTFDAVYRTVRDEPTLDVDTPDRIVVRPDEGDQVRFGLNVTGTGAPVSNIYTRATARNGLTNCNSGQTRRGNVVGMLSRGFSNNRTMCYDVPDAYGTYPVDIWVNSTNANTPAVQRTVVIERRPNVSLDPFTREVLPGDTETYDIQLEGVEDSLASVNLVFRFEDPPTGEFVGASTSLGYDTSNSDITVGPNGDVLTLQLEDVQRPGSPYLAEMTVRGIQPGSTNITVDVVEIRNESSDPEGQFRGTGTREVVGELLVGAGSARPDVTIPGNGTVGDPIDVDIDTDWDIGTGGGDGGTTGGPSIDIDEVVWDFGDGTTAEGPSASHTYDEPGEYNVTVTVVTPDCLVVQQHRTVTVASDDPSERLHADLEPIVAQFNQNVGSGGGGRILGMVSGETVEARVAMTSGETAYLTIRFGSNGRIREFSPGAPDSPTMRMETTEPVIRETMNARNPATAFRQAYDRGDISIHGVGIVNAITVSIGKAVYDVGRTVTNVVGDLLVLAPIGVAGAILSPLQRE